MTRRNSTERRALYLHAFTFGTFQARERKTFEIRLKKLDDARDCVVLMAARFRVLTFRHSDRFRQFRRKSNIQAGIVQWVKKGRVQFSMISYKAFSLRTVVTREIQKLMENSSDTPSRLNPKRQQGRRFKQSTR